MKRVFMLLIIILFGFCLVGCNSDGKVNVDFIIDNISSIVEINKNTIITEDVVPLNSNSDKFLLYYDSTFSKKYNNEPINCNTTIYIRLRNDEFNNNLNEEETFALIIEDYYNEYILNSTDNQLTIDDVSISQYFGFYNGSYVIMFHVTGGGEGWYLLTTINISGVSLTFPTTKTPSVWNKGKFYTLESAYEKGLITVENLMSIKDILNKE